MSCMFADIQGGRNALQIKPMWCPHTGVSRQTWSSAQWTLQPSTKPVVANFSVPSDFLVEGHVSGLGIEHPFSLQASIACGFLVFSRVRYCHPQWMDMLMI